MNILFDCERMKHSYIGLYYYCWNLGNALKKNIVNSNDNITYYYPSSRKEKDFGKDAYYLYQKSYHKLIFPKTKSFDILHCTHQGSSYFPKRRQLKKVLTIHDLNFLHGSNASDFKIKHRIKKIQHMIDNADHIIAISEFVKKEIRQYMNTSGKPVSVIYNGCQIFQKKQIQNPRLLPQVPFIFTIGVFNHKKNFHLIPRLLVGNDYHLVISGNLSNNTYKEYIIGEAAKLGVRNRVFFTGAISEDEKQWYYTNCDAFIFPSIAEGFGLPVIEAMSFGKPVFLSRFTSLPEIGGEDAFYFNSFDADDMLSVFSKGMEEYKKNKELKSIIYKKQASKFSWDNCAKHCLDIYNSLMINS